MSTLNRRFREESKQQNSHLVPANDDKNDGHDDGDGVSSENNRIKEGTSRQMAPPRLILRNQPFHQSKNRGVMIRVCGLSENNTWKILLREDLYHWLLRQGTIRTCFGILILWTMQICLFAWIYMSVDYLYDKIDCGLVNPSDPRRILHFGAYFAFSLQTTTTVGYTLPNGVNGFFEDCPGIQVCIFFQMLLSMIFNACFVTFFYARLAKVENRSEQVIFSNKAILSKSTLQQDYNSDSTTTTPADPNHHDSTSSSPSPPSSWTFSIRVADIDVTHPILEAHVRLYAKVGTQIIEMRLISPNDVLGGCLFLGWPTTLIHSLDNHSPLYPTDYPIINPFQLPHAGLNLRLAEAHAGESYRFVCPKCGEAYGTITQLRNHIAFNQKTEKNDNLPMEGSHREISLEDVKEPPPPSQKELLEAFPDEIIAVVEGVDPHTSGTFQALQSYTRDDIVFGGTFADCCSVTSNKQINIHLEHFHKIVKDDTEEEEVSAVVGTKED